MGGEKRAENKLDKYVQEYIADYYFIQDDDGIQEYSPNEDEKLIIADAIHGLLADEEFEKLFLRQTQENINV